MAPFDGTQQWQHVHSPKLVYHNGTPPWHPSTPSKLVITLPPKHSTPQWHPTMAARPLPQTIAHHNGTPPKSVVTLPPNHSTKPYDGTQQWQHVHSLKVGHHPNIAHHNGTLRWHTAMAARPLPQTIAHHNGTLQWHPAMAGGQFLKVGHPPTIAHHNGTLRWQRSPPQPCTLQWHPEMGPSNSNTALGAASNDPGPPCHCQEHGDAAICPCQPLAHSLLAFWRTTMVPLATWHSRGSKKTSNFRLASGFCKKARVR